MSKRNLNEVVITSGVRTPIGCFGGILKDVSAVELGVTAIKFAIEQSKIAPMMVDQVIMGQVLTAGCKQNPARQAMLKAGIPFTSDCTNVNKLCASGLKAVIYGFQSIAIGDSKVVVAGGMENMSQAPFLLPRKIPKYGGQQLVDSILEDGLLCAISNKHMGLCTESLIKRFNITRNDQDNYAINSYLRTEQAIKSGVFKNEIVPVVIEPKFPGGQTTVISEDEEPGKFVMEKILKLKPVFDKDGTITAANASKINDGAAALVLMSSGAAQNLKVKPLARIVSHADGAVNPEDFGLAPVLSIKKALEKADLKKEDISYWEINEAFSAVPLIAIKELQLDPQIVNIDGGAVSLGHPVGMSGARILAHLLHRLRSDQYGVASICNGGGGSSTVIIQKL